MKNTLKRLKLYCVNSSRLNTLTVGCRYKVLGLLVYNPTAGAYFNTNKFDSSVTLVSVRNDKGYVKSYSAKRFSEKLTI